MLANLTSLIWGSQNEPTTTPTTAVTKTSDPAWEDVSETQSLASIRATTPSDEEESDWVLVDRAEVGDVSYDEGQALQLIPAETTTASASTSASAASVSASPISIGGEISEVGTQEWLVTPPPCFTRSQAAPLATSPLENLLIEHPSMSVYLPRPTYTSASIARIFPQRIMSHSSPSSHSPSASPSSQPTTGETEDSTMREDVGGEGGDQVVEAHTARTGVTQRAPSLLKAIDVLRPAQKAQRRREERRLKRKALEHGNKAREVASASRKPAKRCDMMLPAKFSRAVNNRKC
ncbi:uncharacterized protein TP53INP isoform X2 [Panulirus ornatus]